MQKDFDSYNKKISERDTKVGMEMTIKSLCMSANVSEDVVRVFIDKGNNLPMDFYKENGNGKYLSITETLQKLERVLKIRKVAKLL